MKLSAAAILGAAAIGAGQGIVSLSVHGNPRGQAPARLARSLLRRGELNLAALNNITGGGYYATVAVGTPGQQVQLRLDTGSSDTWVVSPEAPLCVSASAQQDFETGCTATYDYTKSSTYSLVQAGGFSITYLDGNQIKGSYFSDDFTFAGTTVKQQMGLATNTELDTGIIGLGFQINEATNTKYPTLVDNLASSGAIARKAFSLYLNDLHSSDGSILFGGIDTEKFVGQLESLPIKPDPSSGLISSYTIEMTGLSIVGGSSGTNNLTNAGWNMDAILDSGSTLSLLPTNLISTVWKTFHVVSTQQVGLIDCSAADQPGASTTYLEFAFSGATVKVPLSELVVNSLGDAATELGADVPFADACLFGIQDAGLYQNSAGAAFVLLGDSFLRSAYVVYDQTNELIGLAQANLNATKSNLVALDGSSSLPTVTGVATQGAGGSSAPTSSGSGTSPSPTSKKNAASRPGSPPVAGGLGVLALTVVFALVGTAVFAL